MSLIQLIGLEVHDTSRAHGWFSFDQSTSKQITAAAAAMAASDGMLNRNFLIYLTTKIALMTAANARSILEQAIPAGVPFVIGVHEKPPSMKLTPFDPRATK